jgi:hypothetical protein
VLVRRTSVAWVLWALALALPATASASPLITLRHDGGTFQREDRYLPPASDLGMAPSPATPSPASRAGPIPATSSRATPVPATSSPTVPSPATSGAAGARAADATRTVRSELARMLAAGAIDRATYDARLATYDGARGLERKLSGTRRAALGAVLTNLDEIAARGDLNASRLPELFETVARNRQWWANGPLLSYGQRVSFQGSPLVWQYYTGEGLQIQWLGTFGKANALWKIKTHDDDLRKLLDAALALAAQRAGGIAFEYLFDFDGGAPPWASGLAQGTAIQALSRAAIRLNEPRYFEAARSALGIFREPPPSGVKIATPLGAHYLIYSFAPQMRVLNAFTQALNGLHDFAVFANDAEGRAMFTAGEAELRAELPEYDTGAWSRYSLHTEADLSYHKLARDFLESLCTRLREDAAAPAPGAAVAPAPPAAVGSAQTGGAPPLPLPAPTAPPAPAVALPDATPYCTEAQRFTLYLRQPPVVRIVSKRARAGKAAALRFDLSKPSTVKLAVVHGGRTYLVSTAQLESGHHSLRWPRPQAGSGYIVQLRATDLAGNVATTKGSLKVLKRR